MVIKHNLDYANAANPLIELETPRYRLEKKSKHLMYVAAREATGSRTRYIILAPQPNIYT